MLSVDSSVGLSISVAHSVGEILYVYVILGCKASNIDELLLQLLSSDDRSGGVTGLIQTNSCNLYWEDHTR